MNTPAKKGMLAAQSGRLRNANPYPKGSRSHDLWANGFESQKWFELGMKAAASGKTRESCPHQGAVQVKFFRIGYDEQKKFEMAQAVQAKEATA